MYIGVCVYGHVKPMRLYAVIRFADMWLLFGVAQMHKLAKRTA